MDTLPGYVHGKARSDVTATKETAKRVANWRLMLRFVKRLSTVRPQGPIVPAFICPSQYITCPLRKKRREAFISHEFPDIKGAILLRRAAPWGQCGKLGEDHYYAKHRSLRQLGGLYESLREATSVVSAHYGAPLSYLTLHIMVPIAYCHDEFWLSVSFRRDQLSFRVLRWPKLAPLSALSQITPFHVKNGSNITNAELEDW